MKRVLPLLALLLCASLSQAQIRIAGETKVNPYKIVKLNVDGVPPKAGVIWRISPDKDIDKSSASTKTKLEFVAPPGEYRVEALAITLSTDGTTDIQEAKATVVIGTPKPPEPVPPDPGPGPTPVPPTPAPTGFRVLMTYETSQSMPQAQANILYAQSVRDYLQSKCVVGEDKKTKEWRIWDKDVDTTHEGKFWQEAMKRPKASTPWIQIYAGGKLAHEGVLPADVDAALALLKKHGGE